MALHVAQRLLCDPIDDFGARIDARGGLRIDVVVGLEAATLGGAAGELVQRRAQPGVAHRVVPKLHDRLAGFAQPGLGRLLGPQQFVVQTGRVAAGQLADSSRICASSDISDCASVSCMSRDSRSRASARHAGSRRPAARPRECVRPRVRRDPCSAPPAPGSVPSACPAAPAASWPMRAASSRPPLTTRSARRPARISSAERAMSASSRVSRRITSRPAMRIDRPASSTTSSTRTCCTPACANACSWVSRTHTVQPSPGKRP